VVSRADARRVEGAITLKEITAFATRAAASNTAATRQYRPE
jgi:hypothetical protein